VPRFQYTCPLRWSDLDAFGHVNNARFLTLYEEARVALMFVEARKAGVDSFERGVVISRHEIDYMRPVDYAEPVRIELWVEEIRPSRFTVAYELFDGPTVPVSSRGRETAGSAPLRPLAAPAGPASRARTVCVPFDLAAGRPRRLSVAEREFLTPWQE
jgi:acyl-CoA thioester hydrolase